MDFTLSDERAMLRDSLRGTLARAYGGAVRARILASPTGFDPAIWTQLADLGVLGALFTEAEGGFGGHGFDIALVFEELGKAGVVEPVLEAGLAGGLLADAGRGDLVEQVIGGTLHAAFGEVEPGGRFDPFAVETRVDAGRLTGRKSVVVNAEAAGHLLISARTDAGIGLYLAATDAAGLTMRPYPLAGGGRAAEITLDRTPAEALIDDARPAIAARLRCAMLAQTAEALGMMDTVMAMTAEYLRNRQQFGRPIGSFQALQHRMADLLIEVEQARSAVINLAGNLDTDQAARHASAAKNLVGRTALLVAEESVQLHGGIAMTEEYELAHFVRRLTMVEHRFGDEDYHLERFIALARAA